VKQPEMRANETRFILWNDGDHGVDLSTLHAVWNRTTWMLQTLVEQLWLFGLQHPLHPLNTSKGVHRLSQLQKAHIPKGSFLGPPQNWKNTVEMAGT
jgi:hypothetical protein